MKNRLVYMDIAKGLAVLTVVCFHIIVPGETKTVLGVFSNVWMAVLFVASGYFYKPGKLSIGENIKKRFKTVMIPFLKYSFVLGMIGSVFYLLTRQINGMDVLCLFRNFYAGSIWNKPILDFLGWDYHELGTYFLYLAPYWFLIQMFTASIVMYLLADRFVRSGIFRIISSALLLAVPAFCEQTAIDLPYNLDVSCFFAVFMLAGTCLGQKRYFENLDFKKARSWIVFVIFTAVSVTLNTIYGAGFMPFRSIFGDKGAFSVLIMFVGCICFAYSLIFLCRLVESINLKLPVLTYFGRNSLYLYMMHLFFAWSLAQIIGFNLKYSEDVVLPPEDFWISLGLVVFAVVLSAAYIRVREKVLKKIERKTS